MFSQSKQENKGINRWLNEWLVQVIGLCSMKFNEWLTEWLNEVQLLVDEWLQVIALCSYFSKLNILYMTRIFGVKPG